MWTEPPLTSSARELKDTDGPGGVIKGGIGLNWSVIFHGTVFKRLLIIIIITNNFDVYISRGVSVVNLHKSGAGCTKCT